MKAKDPGVLQTFLRWVPFIFISNQTCLETDTVTGDYIKVWISLISSNFISKRPKSIPQK